MVFPSCGIACIKKICIYVTIDLFYFMLFCFSRKLNSYSLFFNILCMMA